MENAKVTEWVTEWGTYTKGQEFLAKYKEGVVTKEVSGLIDYVIKNRYYSLIVLTNGFTYTLWTKLWLELSSSNAEGRSIIKEFI